MQPGRKLSARISVKSPEKRIVVPLQALHHEAGSSYVYLNKSGNYVKQTVESGRKNLYVVEIVEGLDEGDVIALSTPTNINKEAS
jgi:hypothetical protein